MESTEEIISGDGVTTHINTEKGCFWFAPTPSKVGIPKPSLCKRLWGTNKDENYVPTDADYVWVDFTETAALMT